MNINPKKTKQMIIGTLSSSNQTTLNISKHDIELDNKFKLLGITNLKWSEHISFIISKVNKRLFFLRKLKRAAMSRADLVAYYCAVNRPVMECAYPVWHTSLTVGQSGQLEHTQCRAIKIIFGDSLDYIGVCSILTLEPLASRREHQTWRLFNQISDPLHCLHNLLPSKRNPEIMVKLRHSSQYQIPFAKTSRFRNSFIMYCLNNSHNP
jgi:hypothetical protein